MTGPGTVLVRSVPALSPRALNALLVYAETGNGILAAERAGISYQTLKNYLTQAYKALDVVSAFDAFRVLGWLDLSGSHATVAAASLADIEARLAAIHAESGALLAELRSAA